MARFVGYKSAQLLSSGIMGAVAWWVGLYHLQTGNWPWEDDKSRLLKLPFPEWAKNIPGAERLYMNKKSGQWDDINMGFFNPYLDRGLRAVGAPAAYQEAIEGGTPGQAIEAGTIQGANTFMGQFTTSPIIGMGEKLFGFSPYITSIRDERGQSRAQFYNTERTMPPGWQIPYNALYGLVQVNPIIEQAFERGSNLLGMGSYKQSYDSRDNDAIAGWKMILDIAFPRLTSYRPNVYGRERYIHREERAIHSTIYKEKRRLDNKE